MTHWLSTESDEPNRRIYQAASPDDASLRIGLALGSSMIVFGLALLLLVDLRWFLGDFPWWMQLLAGVSAVIQGVMLLSRRAMRITLDRAAGNVILQRRLFGPGRMEVQELNDFTSVLTARNDVAEAKSFVVALAGPNRDNLVLFATDDEAEAQQLASDVAEFLSLPLTPTPDAVPTPPSLDRSATEELPAEIQMEEPSWGLRYIFPPRPLRVRLFYGLLPIGVSLALAGGLIGGVTAFAPNPMVFWVMLAWPFGPILLICLWGVIAGLFSFNCHAEVRVCDQQLQATDRVGPLVWWRSRSVRRIRRLVVVVRGPSPRDASPETLADLIAQCNGVEPLWLATQYPRVWLTALAKDLSHRLGVVAPVVAEEWRDFTGGDRPEQPAGSLTIYERQANGVILRAPPRGVWRSSGGIFGFGLLWCAVLTLMTAGWLFLALTPDGPGLLFLLFLLPFWAIGFGLVLPPIQSGRRRVTLSVVGDDLKLQDVGPFGGVRQQWKRDELTDVRATREVITDDDGQEVVYILVIQPRTGPPFKLHAHRFCAVNDLVGAEAEWYATELRKALRLPVEANSSH